jgi:hypothetical protein
MEGRMGVTEALVLAQNAALAKIPLTAARAAELPVELNQLAAAAEAARHLLQFAAEAADFSRVLHERAWSE